MRFSRIAAMASHEGASLDQFLSVFRESHPSWPQVMSVVGISGIGIVVTAIGGTWTAASKVMDAQLDPIQKDITIIKESQQQTAAVLQEIQKELHDAKFLQPAQG